MKTPARKTSGILLLAAAVIGGALLLHAARRGSLADEPDSTDPLKVRARMESSHILVGTSEAHIAVTVQAPDDRAGRSRPELNLAIVLDRSGSMSGEKLQHAKEAARALVEKLSPGDRFALVVYGSDVQVIFPSALASAGNKAAAVAAIDSVYDDGGTNLSGGLEAGRDQILAHAMAQTVARVVLISDGLANEGITDPEALAALARATAERGVSITTVGVGLDFDERTMTRVAVAGAGNYYFAESSAVLSDLFGQELQKVGATTATEVRLALAPAPGVEVLEAYGYPLEHQGQRVLVPVADLHAGEVRKVVVRLRVTATKPGAIDVAGVEVSYKPVDSDLRRTVSMQSRSEVTRDRQEVIEGRDREAMRHIERARTAKAIDDATEMYERGEPAAAQAVLKQRFSESAEVADQLGDDELKSEISAATGSAGQAMDKPPASTGGKRASKTNRKDAYMLAH